MEIHVYIGEWEIGYYGEIIRRYSSKCQKSSFLKITKGIILHKILYIPRTFSS